MKYFLYCRKSTEAEDRQVMSLDSQRAEIERAFGARPEIELVDVITESKSAKAPGRPLFGEMIRRIEKGEAQGIIAWAPDRLARNSIDGGHVVYLLDTGVLSDMKFVTYTFENNAQGKFMLSIMFGYSKYYSDNLSDVVKRGNRAKIERGWRPNVAPTGYLNDVVTKTTTVDPVRFPLVQQLFHLVRDGTSARDATRIAREHWGFTTENKRQGGNLVSASTVHHILTNPFYAGVIVWGGQSYPGRHRPAVSMGEFEAVQRQLKRAGPTRPKRLQFAYTGLIRCGSCGLGITAEHKVNRQGHRYIYYHCSRPKLGPRCTEPSIEARALEAQIQTCLDTLQMEPAVERAFWRLVESEAGRIAGEASRESATLAASLEDVERQARDLTELRLRGLLSDLEFVEQRTRLERERGGLVERLTASHAEESGIEPVKEIVAFCRYAAKRYPGANAAMKRHILSVVGSNPTLSGKKLSIGAAKPFQLLAEFNACPSELGDSDNVPNPATPAKSLRPFILACAHLAADEPARMQTLHRSLAQGGLTGERADDRFE